MPNHADLAIAVLLVAAIVIAALSAIAAAGAPRHDVVTRLLAFRRAAGLTVALATLLLIVSIIGG